MFTQTFPPRAQQVFVPNVMKDLNAAPKKKKKKKKKVVMWVTDFTETPMTPKITRSQKLLPM